MSDPVRSYDQNGRTAKTVLSLTRPYAPDFVGAKRITEESVAPMEGLVRFLERLEKLAAYIATQA